MRHREAARHDLAGCHVDHDAAMVPPGAPAGGNVRTAHRGEEGRAAAIHGEAVEVAAILRHQRGHELRLPYRAKARGLADGRETIVQRVDEDRPPRAV